MVSQVIAVAIFVAVIGVIVSEKLHRAACALIGAMLLILIGILEPKEALGFIDFNTIGVLIGMMMFVAVVKNSGIFEFLAIKSAKIAKGNPWRIMIAFMIITAVLSAFLDNVTTVLLIGPMTFSICQKLELNPANATGVVSGETLGFQRTPTVKGTNAGTYTDVDYGTWYVTKANDDDSTGNYELDISGTLEIT